MAEAVAMTDEQRAERRRREQRLRSGCGYGGLDHGRDPRHRPDVARFSYARYSSEARDVVMATSALAYAENVPAEPRHLRRALTSRPSPDEWERYRAAKPGPDSVYSVFTPELTAVLERALELAEASVDTEHLAAALDSSPI